MLFYETLGGFLRGSFREVFIQSACSADKIPESNQRFPGPGSNGITNYIGPLAARNSWQKVSSKGTVVESWTFSQSLFQKELWAKSIQSCCYTFRVVTRLDMTSSYRDAAVTLGCSCYTEPPGGGLLDARNSTAEADLFLAEMETTTTQEDPNQKCIWRSQLWSCILDLWIYDQFDMKPPWCLHQFGFNLPTSHNPSDPKNAEELGRPIFVSPIWKSFE